MRRCSACPWERGEATPTGRAAKASGINLDPRVEAPFIGFGLDETLLARIATGFQRVPPERAVLISGLPEAERARDRRRARRDALPTAAGRMPARPDSG